MLVNERFLITQPIARGYNGSTIVTLELAEYLKNQGAKVTVYTCDLADPAKAEFEKRKITITSAQENPTLKLSDFDYIWVHSQILPLSIIEELSKPLPPKLPKFIFLHMSGMDWIPDEKPWIYDLENKLSSLSLFICEEILEINRPLLSRSIPTAFFRNPTPESFNDRKQKPHPKLKNILIVSNHPPHELEEAKTILQDQYHLNVFGLGETQDSYKLFDVSTLEKADAVITIAKTVPYCLVSGTPVYIYDAFGGGPGWLNTQNFEPAKKRNFSGYQNNLYPNYEGGVFHYKSSKQITQEILKGYNSALLFHEQNRQTFQKEFNLETVLPSLLKQAKTRPFKPFSKAYQESVIAAERFATIRFEIGGVLFTRDELIRQQTTKLNQLEKEINSLIKYKRNTEEIFNSGAYNLFNKLITPYKKLRSKK